MNVLYLNLSGAPTVCLRHDFAGQATKLEPFYCLVKMNFVISKNMYILCCIIKLQQEKSTALETQKKNPRLLLPSKYLEHPHEILPSLWRQLPAPSHSHTQTASPPLVPKAVFYVLSNLWYFSIFFSPDCSVFQFQTKTLFSFFY